MFLSVTNLGKTLVPSKYPKLKIFALQNGCILALVIIFDRLFSFLINARNCSVYSSPVK